MGNPLFGSDLWKPVLDKYAAVTGLTVELFDLHGHVVLRHEQPTPMYALFEEHQVDTGLFEECARTSLKQKDSRPAVIAADAHGLLVVGTSLVLDGGIVGAAVAGYALSQFPQVAAVQRWALSTRVPFDRLWLITRQQPPMPERRLRLHGELLQVLGDALLRENLRTRQHEAAVSKLQAADAAKDDFLAMLSHELRSPLTPILGWASVLKKHEGSEMVRKAAEVIERNVLHQARMIEDLLDINLITHGTVKLDVKIHDLLTLTHAALDTCASQVKKKGISVEESGAREPLHVKGDAGRLQQVFTNVLGNAVKFTPVGGRIRITLTREGEAAVVSVADNGEGIAPEFLPFVFEPFRQQEQGTRRQHEGLGIGLALVKRLTELHRGTVTITSEGIGRGVEVVVRLPLADPFADRDTVVASDPSTEALAGLSILVVEDSDDAREALHALLLYLGAEVTTASDGRDALELLRHAGASPDLIFCDLRMPRMDGYEFIRELLRAPGATHPPVVAMSGLVSESDRALTKAAGFKAHIAKPFVEAAIVAVANSVVTRLANKN